MEILPEQGLHCCQNAIVLFYSPGYLFPQAICVKHRPRFSSMSTVSGCLHSEHPTLDALNMFGFHQGGSQNHVIAILTRPVLSWVQLSHAQ